VNQVFRSGFSVGRGRANGRSALLLLLSAFIPIVLICGVAGLFFVRSQTAALDRIIGERTSGLAVTLGRELETQVQLLSILSESPTLDPPIEAEAFSEVGERLRARIPVWDIVRVTDGEGRLLHSVPEARSAQPQQRVVDVESHKRLFTTKRAVIGNIALGPRKLPAFPVRVPVLREGQAVYGLSAVIRPSSLNDILHANGLPQSWIGWITDGKGRLVATTADVPQLITLPATQLVEVGDLHEQELSSGRLYSGETLRVAAATVAGTDWTVSVGMPVAEYQRIASQELYVLAASGGVTMVLAALALWLLLCELEARRSKELELAGWQRMDALGKLTGGLAHDFNNLLMVFQSSAESLKRRRDDGAHVERLLQGMLDAVSRGRTLTQRLLSYSRRSNQNARPTRLQDQLEPLRDMLDKAAQDAVELRISFPDDLWPVNIEPQAFETTMINLVTNAREAMRSGGVVEVSARNIPNLKSEAPRLNGPGIVVTVSDTGSGISEQDRVRVFEPFYTTKQDGSSGLGLSQVHAFAERSAGAVTLSRGEPRGAVFNLYLPRHIPVAASRAPVAAEPSRLPTKVLVVDDTAASLEASKLTLEDLGIKVIAVSSGRAALAALHREKGIEAVLTDIRMPGMSGLQLAEYIAVMDSRIAIVLMTGFSEEVEIGHGVDLPVLMKPFTSESLVTTLTSSWAGAKASSH
jgi:signal transduction histidine kinase/CheY-like chemotaxis protein